jgi:Holliday junction resolvasome RuvABC DNA-binding subunit
MANKREEARHAAEARARTVAAEEQARAAAKARAQEVIPYLRKLGFRANESQQAAALCETIPHATLEERVKRALSYFRPPGRTHAPALGAVS